ncbi:MAG: hypothetical protein KU37_07315 [Sulfuricurvum sp. PC08-66]|nr:MAG: hypothetical protein KU37_07315 [Sulfuricurvum sp. PC08-66]
MSWAFGWVLWLLPLWAVLAWLGLRKYPTSRASIVLLGLAAMSMTFALSRPYIPAQESAQKVKTAHIIVGVDLSYSMQANDVTPTRFEATKAQLAQLVEASTHDKFALLGFTSSAIILSPLTDDKSLLLGIFERLENRHIVSKSTRILPLMELASRMTHEQTPTVVIFSDGGEGALEEEIAYCQSHAIRVYTVGMATAVGTTLLDAKGQIQKDESGTIVVSRLNSALARLAQACGGSSYSYDASMSDLYADVMQKVALQESEVYTHTGVQLFYGFVALALVLVMVAVTSLVRFVPLVALLTLLAMPTPSSAAWWDSYSYAKAYSAYTQGDYVRVVATLEKLEETPFEVALMLGNAYYALGDFDQALAHYKALQSGDKSAMAIVWYNIGNAYAKRHVYSSAKEAYTKSLQLHPTPEAYENMMQVWNLLDEVARPNRRQEPNAPQDGDNAKAQAKGAQKKAGGGTSTPQGGIAQQGKGASQMNSKKKSPQESAANPNKAILSSKQYELINQGGMNETRPW